MALNGLSLQHLQRTPRNKFVGDECAEFFGGHVQRGFVQDVRSLFAIERDHHRVQVPLIVYLVAKSAEGELAAGAEGVEHGAFGGYGVFGIGVVERVDGSEDGRVTRGIFGV